MPADKDRIEELLEGITRKKAVIVSPEGVPLEIQIASHGERLTALVLDLCFMFAAIICLYLVAVALFFAHTNISVGMTLVLFLSFLVRNLYFLHFELAWQGRTPGKRICRLRVISSSGGELAPSAVIARNLTREVEIFLPVSLFFSLGSGSGWQGFALLGWSLAITSLPLFNEKHLRAGDLIGGTQVIAMPKRALLADIAAPPAKTDTRMFSFTPEQLAIYGRFELQVLEEILRRPPTRETQELLATVCEKIRRKIKWDDPVAATDARRFLTEFYTAERADLERGQLFGRYRADKDAAV